MFEIILYVFAVVGALYSLDWLYRWLDHHFAANFREELAQVRMELNDIHCKRKEASRNAQEWIARNCIGYDPLVEVTMLRTAWYSLLSNLAHGHFCEQECYIECLGDRKPPKNSTPTIEDQAAENKAAKEDTYW